MLLSCFPFPIPFRIILASPAVHVKRTPYTSAQRQTKPNQIESQKHRLDFEYVSIRNIHTKKLRRNINKKQKPASTRDGIEQKKRRARWKKEEHTFVREAKKNTHTQINRFSFLLVCRSICVFDSLLKNRFLLLTFFCIEIEFTSFVYGWLVTKDKHDDNRTYVCVCVCCFSLVFCQCIGKGTLLKLQPCYRNDTRARHLYAFVCKM